MAESKKTTTKSEKSGAVFDVAKPGKSVPSSSAKPIIVTNRPVLKDPMMVEENETSAADSEPVRSPSLPSTKVRIEPLSAQKPEAEEADDTPVITHETDKTEEPTKEPEEEVEKEEKTAGEPDVTEVGDSTTESSPKNDAKKAEEAEEAELKKAAERAEELDKLAESRKFYLPINQLEKRRTKRYVLLGVVFIVILGLAWADVALDAGIITIPGVKAPTHFFK